MKRVKIVNGIYGYQPDDGKKAKGDDKKKARRTIPIPRGEYVEVTDSEAKRLVEMKVAVYAEETKSTEETKAPGNDSGMPDLNAEDDVV